MTRNLKIKNFVVSMAFAMGITSSVFAGERGGNGGDALVCPSGVMLLDYFEATTRNELNIELPGSTLREKTANVVKRLSRLDPVRSKTLENTINDMVTDFEKKAEDPQYRMKFVKLSPGIELVDIDDSKEIALPVSCEKKQLVIQKEVVLPEDRLYEFSKDIWDQMDLDQQALTITHEAWYRITIFAGALDSRFARVMNGLFASVQSETMTFGDYLVHLENAPKYGKFVELSDVDAFIYQRINGKGGRPRPFYYETTFSEHYQIFDIDLENTDRGQSIILHTRSDSSGGNRYYANNFNIGVISVEFGQDAQRLKLIGKTSVYRHEISNLHLENSDCSYEELFDTPKVSLVCSTELAFYEKKMYTAKKGKRFKISFDLENSVAVNVKIEKL